MGLRTFGSVTMVGNFEKPRRYKNGKPRDWIERDYKAIVPYPFKWRTKIGKTECTCVECIEAYQPYYGWTWYHSDECALMRQVRERPSLLNLWCYQTLPEIAQSE